MGKYQAWCVSFVLLGSVSAAEQAAYRPRPYDWPQWQGVDRTAVSQEKGLLKHWPKGGPRLLWKARDLGGGYSTPSVAAGRVFGMSYRNRDEIVWALDEGTGKELWSRRIAAAEKVSYGEGSRCTPTVDDSRLYALGVGGDLVCLDVATGKPVWHKHLVKDFGGGRPGWGYCESPLVDGDVLVATPGGRTATLVALNKHTGSTLWSAPIPGDNAAQYASGIKTEVAGLKQYVQFLKGGVVGVAAEDGRLLWRYDRPANGTANCSTPVAHNNSVFAASDYGKGGGLVHLARTDSQVKAEEAYFTKHMKNQHGGMVLVDGYLYGANDPHFLTCLEFATGKLMWENERPGKGSIAYADGLLFYRNENGTMVLAEASPRGYVVRGRFHQPDRSGKNAWPHPVVANGRLYLRDQDVLLCYDVKQP
jgi:outer membrane protein assembly factor BamB